MLQQVDMREEFRRQAAFVQENEDSIIARLEGRLASGTSKLRIANETGLPLQTIDRIVGRESTSTFSVFSNIKDSRYEILSILENWLNEEDATAPNTEDALAVTPTYQRITSGEAVRRLSIKHGLSNRYIYMVLKRIW